MDKLAEIVWGIKVEDLFLGSLEFNGYKTPASQVFLYRIYKESIPMSRRDCEEDPKFKHIIPYCMLTSETNQIFVTRRTTNQTEGRLHGKASIGVGGHIGPERFMTIKDSIYVGMLRELQEELIGMELVGHAFDFMPRLVGVVNDDSNPVGAVHFGLVYEVLIDPERMDSIKIKETDNMVGEWMPRREALKVENYESWSALILREV